MLVAFATQAQTVGKEIPPEITDGVQIETHSRLYNQAYLEMADMLDGKTELSIKRAVFLAEWAYLDGDLDYDWFCKTIDSVTIFVQKFIVANKLGQYKTAKNMALIEYFFNPWSGNNYKPFIYDFEKWQNPDDFTYQFVSKVMRTHEGQCRSLPYYYKILAEAVGAESYITYAPEHVFIRYRDEDNLFPEDWVNVEVTSHQLQPEFWIREHNEITDKMIESGMYLRPLTDRETVAAQLSDLAHGYLEKYNNDYDDFTWLCVTKSLEYHPQRPNTLIIKGKTLDRALMKHLSRTGGLMDNYALFLEKELIETSHRLEALGWEPMSTELKDKLDTNAESGRKIQEETSIKILTHKCKGYENKTFDFSDLYYRFIFSRFGIRIPSYFAVCVL